MSPVTVVDSEVFVLFLLPQRVADVYLRPTRSNSM